MNPTDSLSTNSFTCKICWNTNYNSILNLGAIYPSNFIKSGQEIVSPVPLHLVECAKCGLVQLKEVVNLDDMYRQYWYRSGINYSMIQALKNIVDSIKSRIELSKDDFILDIGCNDGTMLSLYNNDCFKVGFDPALNLREVAEQHCDIFVNDYFSLDGLFTDKHSIKIFSNRFKVITAIAMLYDLEAPELFIESVKDLLHKDGIFVVQFTDLLSMLKCNAFDNICHEHIEYYSLRDLDLLFKTSNMDIFDVEYNNINGGSVRVWVCHKGSRKISPRVSEALAIEDDYLQSNPPKIFSSRILKEKSKLLSIISAIKNSNEKIYVLGASTKGNTLLQHYNLTSDLIDCALEINKEKFGLRTIGTNIPVIPEEEGLKQKPDYLLCLPWHFRDFFISRFKDYLLSGGKLIFPLPSVTVITKEIFK